MVPQAAGSIVDEPRRGRLARQVARLRLRDAKQRLRAYVGARKQIDAGRAFGLGFIRMRAHTRARFTQWLPKSPYAPLGERTDTFGTVAASANNSFRYPGLSKPAGTAGSLPSAPRSDTRLGAVRTLGRPDRDHDGTAAKKVKSNWWARHENELLFYDPTKMDALETAGGEERDSDKPDVDVADWDYPPQEELGELSDLPKPIPFNPLIMPGMPWWNKILESLGTAVVSVLSEDRDPPIPEDRTPDVPKKLVENKLPEVGGSSDSDLCDEYYLQYLSRLDAFLALPPGAGGGEASRLASLICDTVAALEAAGCEGTAEYSTITTLVASNGILYMSPFVRNAVDEEGVLIQDRGAYLGGFVEVVPTCSWIK